MRREAPMRCTGAPLAAVLALAGCGGELTDPPSPPAPVLEAAAAATQPGNVLSVLVTGRARFTDSVAVRYGIRDAALDSVTPAVVPTDGEVALPMFGLLPDTTYELRLMAYGEGGTASSEPLYITTGSLPADLPRFRAGGPSPSPGYVLFAAGWYGLVIDNTGRVVWYIRYVLDEVGHTARLTGTYVPTAATRASLGGTTQALPGRHTLVAFGDGGVVQEYDGDGAVVWEIEGDPGYVFRAQRIRSLYHPEIGLAR